jgi:hypothetical protein
VRQTEYKELLENFKVDARRISTDLKRFAS